MHDTKFHEDVETRQGGEGRRMDHIQQGKPSSSPPPHEQIHLWPASPGKGRGRCRYSPLLSFLGDLVLTHLPPSLLRSEWKMRQTSFLVKMSGCFGNRKEKQQSTDKKMRRRVNEERQGKRDAKKKAGRRKPGK